MGIISDTHDNIPNVMKAVGVFKERGVEFVIHLGDIVAPATIPFFKGLKMKFLKGNCDGDLEMIQKQTKEIGGEYFGDFAKLEVDGKRIAALHGKDKAKVQQLAESQEYDYVLYGHDHTAKNEKMGRTRVINPGAHYLSPKQPDHSIALLDVGKGEVEFVEIE